MDATIQGMLDNVSPNGIVKLPNGEFEGPFTVSKPCTIKGSSTTFWADKGPVIIIAQSAGNVYLKHLRIEITGATNDFRRVAIENNSSNLHIENVEVDGDVKGYNGESDWILPKSVNAGAFAAEKTNTYILNIFNNSDAEIVSNINGITVSPSYLNRGLNTITLQTDSIKDRTCIYGEILIKSAFIRRIYVSGRSVCGVDAIDRKQIFNAEMSPLFLENYSSMKLSEPIETEQVNNQKHVPDGNENMARAGRTAEANSNNIVTEETAVQQKIELQRGQRIPLPPEISDVKVRFLHQTRNVSVDTYAFQLMANNRVSSDEGLIFFGNNHSSDESIHLSQIVNGDEFAINLTKNPSNIEKICFVCSVYSEENEHNSFSSVEHSDMYVTVGTTEYHCRVNDVCNGQSMVALEIYLYKSEWKIRIIASEIHKNISDICGDYGVAVD